MYSGQLKSSPSLLEIGIVWRGLVANLKPFDKLLLAINKPNRSRYMMIPCLIRYGRQKSSSNHQLDM
jgi:hypothetical protein